MKMEWSMTRMIQMQFISKWRWLQPHFLYISNFCGNPGEVGRWGECVFFFSGCSAQDCVNSKNILKPFINQFNMKWYISSQFSNFSFNNHSNLLASAKTWDVRLTKSWKTFQNAEYFYFLNFWEGLLKSFAKIFTLQILLKVLQFIKWPQKKISMLKTCLMVHLVINYWRSWFL